MAHSFLVRPYRMQMGKGGRLTLMTTHGFINCSLKECYPSLCVTVVIAGLVVRQAVAVTGQQNLLD